MSLLGDVKKAQWYLLGKMDQLGFDVQNQAELQILTENVLKSSEIEGEKFNATHVRSSVARRIVVHDEIIFCDDKNIEGAVEITIDAIRNSNIPVTQERLFGWHAALFHAGGTAGYV